MDWEDQIIAALKEADIRLVSHVPDAIIWRVLSRIEKDPFFNTVPCNREDDAVGIAVGSWLGRQRAAVFLQCSGFGNVGNALGSLSVPCKIPFPLFCSMRGELNEFNSAQVPGARAVRPTMTALGMDHYTLDDTRTVQKTVSGAIYTAFSTSIPVCILIGGQLSGGKRIT